jgi:UDP-glucose 4-epimerase
MRVVVTGASGNVGTAVLRALCGSDRVSSVVGMARRPPDHGPPGTDRVEWAAGDVTTADLAQMFSGADGVIHLAWGIQPSHDLQQLHTVNVTGTRRVLQAVARAGVRAVVHASSVGVYSPRTTQNLVGEDHPRDGIASSGYSRDKAHCEALLDAFELEHPEVRVARLRPALIFQGSAGSEITRYFLGRMVPTGLVRPGLLPYLPLPRGLVLQCVHADDVADAYLRVVTSDDARGAYNVVAQPALDTSSLAGVLGFRPLLLPPSGVRAAIAATWHLHLQPTDPGWLDMAMQAPLLSAARIAELGWVAHHAPADALRELVGGIRDRAGDATSALRRLPTLPARLLGHDRTTR